MTWRAGIRLGDWNDNISLRLTAELEQVILAIADAWPGCPP